MAVLWDPSMDPVPLRATKDAARSLGLQLQILEVRGPGEFESAFRAASRGHAQALWVYQSPMMDVQPTQIAALALKYRLPATSIFSHFTEAGLLMSYGPNLNNLFGQAARA